MKLLALFIGLLLLPVFAMSADRQGGSEQLRTNSPVLTHMQAVMLSREIFGAVQSRDEQRLRNAIAAGADVNSRDDWGDGCVLGLAILKGQIGSVNILIASGANVNVKNSRGDTMLDLAVQSNQTEIVRILIAAGANINSNNGNGHTPLYWALKQPQMVAVLLSFHPDLNIRDRLGRTVLDFANDPQSKALIRAAMEGNVDKPVVATPMPLPAPVTPQEPITIAVAPEFQTVDEVIHITGRITGGNKAMMVLTVNGKPTPVNANGSFDFQRIVLIGETELHLVAKTDENQGAAANIKIIRSAPAPLTSEFAPLDPAHLHGTPRPEAIALIIGIDQYENLPSAEFAENDANAFYDYATKALGVPASRVKLLVGPNARRLDAKKALQTWLKPLIAKGRSEVFVFFSGHGLSSEDGKDVFLLPYDGDRAMLADSSIRRKELIDTIVNAGAVSTTLFLDTCYSGGTRGKDSLTTLTRPVMITAKEQPIPPNVTILAAAANDQLSNALAPAKHGLFSYFLMKGLEGDAAGPDNIITATRLEQYLMDHVPTEAAKLGRSQTPQIMGDGERVVAWW